MNTPRTNVLTSGFHLIKLSTRKTTRVHRQILFRPLNPAPHTRVFSSNMSQSKNQEAIAATLNKYKDALNDSSVDQAVALYTKDGIVMPQHIQAGIGTDAIRKTYENIFAAIALHVKFDMKEIVETGPGWAFARTTSAGHTTIHGKGGDTEGGAEGNQELFVMQEVDGDWKIARYCFCTTNPPPGAPK